MVTDFTLANFSDDIDRGSSDKSGLRGRYEHTIQRVLLRNYHIIINVSKTLEARSKL